MNVPTVQYRRGDVVTVLIPFSDGVGSKSRPALVVQCDRNNSRIDKAVLVQITSRTHFARTAPTQLLFEFNTLVGRQSGLLNDSAVACENLLTMRQDVITRKIGQTAIGG